MVALIRDPVSRFESAWRFGLNVAKLARNTSDITWGTLSRRFPRGVNAFVEEARARNWSTEALLNDAGVQLFDPSLGTGICCPPPPAQMTPLLSPQHWWVRPATLRGVRGVRSYIICTEHLTQDTQAVMTALRHPAAHQPQWMSHAHMTKQSAATNRLSKLTADNAIWVRQQYAEDLRLHQLYCANRTDAEWTMALGGDAVLGGDVDVEPSDNEPARVIGANGKVTQVRRPMTHEHAGGPQDQGHEVHRNWASDLMRLATRLTVGQVWHRLKLWLKLCWLKLEDVRDRHRRDSSSKRRLDISTRL